MLREWMSLGATKHYKNNTLRALLFYLYREESFVQFRYIDSRSSCTSKKCTQISQRRFSFLRSILSARYIFFILRLRYIICFICFRSLFPLLPFLLLFLPLFIPLTHDGSIESSDMDRYKNPRSHFHITKTGWRRV